MKKWIALSALLFAVGFACLAQAQLPLTHGGKGAPNGGFVGSCTESTNAVARTSGLNSTYQSAYDALICGLVYDGTWAKFDAFYIYATSSSSNALINLVQNAYNGTVNGSPTFTAAQGYTGIDASTTDYIDTGFNPTTASSPQFTQNSAHVGVWENTSSGGAGGVAGTVIGSYLGTAPVIELVPYYQDTHGFCYLNANASGGDIDTGVLASGFGYFICNRDTSTSVIYYVNDANRGSNSTASTASPNANLYILARARSGGTADAGNGNQFSIIHFGASLVPTQMRVLDYRIGLYRAQIGLTP